MVSLPTAVIFDWDGVVIDSEDFHRRSWDLLAAEEGLVIPPGAFDASFGMRNQQILPDIFQWVEAGDGERIQALADRKEVLYRQIIREERIDPLPGVVELLRELAAAKIPTSVGSSTPRENIETVMDVIGVRDLFQAIVAADDVRRGKPDPEVFLTAAERLGQPPVQAVVIEDAHVGIEAARPGGFSGFGGRDDAFSGLARCGGRLCGQSGGGECRAIEAFVWSVTIKRESVLRVVFIGPPGGVGWRLASLLSSWSIRRWSRA